MGPARPRSQIDVSLSSEASIRNEIRLLQAEKEALRSEKRPYREIRRDRNRRSAPEPESDFTPYDESDQDSYDSASVFGNASQYSPKPPPGVSKR